MNFILNCIIGIIIIGMVTVFLLPLLIGQFWKNKNNFDLVLPKVTPNFTTVNIENNIQQKCVCYNKIFDLPLAFFYRSLSYDICEECKNLLMNTKILPQEKSTEQNHKQYYRNIIIRGET